MEPMPDYLREMLPDTEPQELPVPTVVADDSVPDYLRGYFKEAPTTDPNNKPVLERWSFSDWSVWKACPYVLYARRIIKVASTGESEANVRGNAIHGFIEHRLNTGEVFGASALDLLPKLTKTEAFLEYLEGFTAKDVPEKAWQVVDEIESGPWQITPEAKFYFDRNWEPTVFDDRWLTLIIDVLAIDHDQKKILIVDWKTGKKNSVKHTQQGSLYAVAMHHLYPDYDISVRFVYLDSEFEWAPTPDLTLSYRPDSKRLAKVKEIWADEGNKITSATKMDFAPLYNPDQLVTVPPYLLPFLKDASNYDDAHFPAPIYAK